MTTPARLTEAHMPNVIHPAYAGQPNLVDWVEGRHRDDRVFQVYLPPSRHVLAKALIADKDLIDPGFRTMTMTRYKAVAPAPYVGRPFAYLWWVGVDELGRAIAGDARIHYTVDEADWEAFWDKEGQPRVHW
jgi:hypothetical protein